MQLVKSTVLELGTTLLVGEGVADLPLPGAVMGSLLPTGGLQLLMPRAVA